MNSSGPKKRTKTIPYTEEALKEALAEARDKKRSIRQICKKYGIPKTTILDRIKGRTTDLLKKPGPDPVLGKDGEKKIVEWLNKLAKCGFRLKKKELFDTVQKMIKDIEINNTFKDDRPGERWFQGFLNRNKEISLKYAEGMNKSRTTVTEESIRLWFKEFEQHLDTIGHRDILDHPERIFNCHENGFALCPKTGKVLGPIGYKNQYHIKPGNEKEIITVLLTFNAKGDVCPHCVVFPYVRPPKSLANNMPSGWYLGKSESGRMRADIFLEYITNNFNNWLEQNNIKKPVLFLIDGYKSQMSLMLSTLCDQLEIILYALPPNNTHILKPAEASVFAPLKTYWKNTVRKYLSKSENLNSVVTKTNFCTLIEDTLKEPSIPEDIRKAFLSCGIYPFNANSPDSSKCVWNTLENIKAPQDKRSSNHITAADIMSTKKVLNYLKPTLKKKNINVHTILEELQALNKSLLVENNKEMSIEIEIEPDNNTNCLISLEETTKSSIKVEMDV